MPTETLYLTSDDRLVLNVLEMTGAIPNRSQLFRESIMRVAMENDLGLAIEMRIQALEEELVQLKARRMDIQKLQAERDVLLGKFVKGYQARSEKGVSTVKEWLKGWKPEMRVLWPGKTMDEIVTLLAAEVERRDGT